MKSNQKKKGRSSIYPISLKIAIAKEWLKGEKGYRSLAKEYGLEQWHTVRHFVQWYQDNYEGQDELVPAKLTEEEELDNAVLRKKMKVLENQLENANLKIDSLNIAISIAEESFKIEIRKKSGSKQQTK